MKASVFQSGKFSIQDLPSPTPGPGEVLVRPLVCGICGSDLHTRHHAHSLAELFQRGGFQKFMDPEKPTVMGHEFCCEVLDFGPGCEKKFERGTRIVGLPFLEGANGIELVGYSNHYYGAFAEEMVLQEKSMFSVPDHVESDVAALAEPLSVAVRAVRAAEPTKDTAFTIYGCGPVGLFIIARLRHLGFGPILAIDPDPQRRVLAEMMGADEVMEPSTEKVEQWWNRHGQTLSKWTVSTSRNNVPAKRPVIFECVGKVGMIQSIAEEAPVECLIVVVGLCMQTDKFEPGFMLQKDLQLRFVLAYSPEDFVKANQMISDAPQRLAPLVTGHVTLDDVEKAFDRLERGGSDAKVMVSPTDLLG